MFCHKCGAQVDDQAAFCDKCGTALTNTLRRDTAAPPPPATPGPGAPPPGYAAPVFPAAVQYAGFWRRFAAAIIDALIMMAVQIVVFFALGALNILSVGDLSDVGTAEYNTFMLRLYIVTAVLVPLEILFFSALESSSFQATPGKLALGIKVTDLDGNRVSLARATARVVLKAAPGIVSTGMGIAVYALAADPEDWGGLISLVSLLLVVIYIVIAFTPRKQGLHDMAAGTLVVVKK